jgi:hypothetical protein
MILICGGLADPVTELVCSRLEACRYTYRLLDFGLYPAGYRVHWHWRRGAPTGYIAGPDWTVTLDALTGVYVRYLGSEGRQAPVDVPAESVPALYAEHDAGVAALVEHLPCLVVNRLRGGMSNHSKPYQALIAQACGLRTPPTLMTNDPAAVGAFLASHDGHVIYKSLSGVRSIVRMLGPDQLARLSYLGHGPAQFQAFIPGDNVRVHTVADRLFATRIRSDAVDYRYARREGSDVHMEPIDLPPAIAAACVRVARLLDLPLAGIDLKLTPNGDWYCFEVNPSPGFLYYEQHTGQPISLALADLLRSGMTSARPEITSVG